jgi:serine/threonine protein kinase
MAPELLLEGHASRSSDVYAFGVLLWEMTTGKRAFQGYPLAMLVHRVADRGGRPPWPRKMVIPEQLKVLVEHCWHQEASQR